MRPTFFVSAVIYTQNTNLPNFEFVDPVFWKKPFAFKDKSFFLSILNGARGDTNLISYDTKKHLLTFGVEFVVTCTLHLFNLLLLCQPFILFC